MQILIVTPAPEGSFKGNRVTAERWKRLLRSLGHQVEIDTEYRGQACDALVSLHARKSFASVDAFARRRPQKPIILTLTGTDLYQDIQTSGEARRSLELAWRLIVLQPHGLNELSQPLQAKARVIIQSAEPLQPQPAPLDDCFEVCVSGHLREVKDPFRAAEAARRLPADSAVQITHVGAALSDEMQRRAEAETQNNARYRWLGGVDHQQARTLLARARLMALTSRSEGGANVVCEALALGTSVISSRISGSLGLLGEDYPGYFDVGDTQGLADLMLRCEQDAPFYQAISDHCRQRASLVAPDRERSAWRDLLAELPPAD